MPSASYETLKRKEAEAFLSLGTSAFYKHQSRGVLPPPVKLCGTNASFWLLDELKAVKGAMIAGCDTPYLQRLVAQLVEGRKALAPSI